MSTGCSIDDWKAIKSEMLRQGVLQQKLEASSCGGYFCKGHTLLISIVALLLNIFKNSLANYHGKLTGALVLSGSRLRHDLAYIRFCKRTFDVIWCNWLIQHTTLTEKILFAPGKKVLS